MMKYAGLIWFLLILSLASCNEKTVFKFRGADETGLTFNNQIEPFLSDAFNVLDFEYVYNGGGVAAGDLNNDGLIDLFFAGNFVSSKLYLNRGDLKFEDVTDRASVATSRWATGTSLIDINNDGLLDIYVCVGGADEVSESQENYFFINQGTDEAGIPTFQDQAEEMGLNQGGHSTMAAFFDYDLDGDLDVYLLTNAQEVYNRNNVRSKVVDGSAKSNDMLMRNEGNGSFTDVSKEAGILIEGWGLGVSISDINQDGWPDVYVANDFLSNDLIWINQKDGTFRDAADEYLKVQTHNGMGVDIADYNNDLLQDIIVLDMLPEGNYREKMMISAGNYDKLQMSRSFGYGDQFMRNTLQLNQGQSSQGQQRFSEIGYLAGIFRTDWSWAPLFADFDNDGFKDLFVANGYRKDVTNLDYIVYSQQSAKKNQFSPEETRQELVKQSVMEALNELDEVKLPNYMYKNDGDLTFSDVTMEWGLDIPGFSNGAVYADLDNDGDLDLVTNNIDDPVFLFENTINTHSSDSSHYLRITLESGKPVVGTKVIANISGNKQLLEYNPYRGYKSSVEPILHFGTGKNEMVDTLTVIWPDQRISTLYDLPTDQVIEIGYEGSRPDSAEGKDEGIGNTTQVNPLFEDVTDQTTISEIKHTEDGYDDFKDIPMLPFQLSRYGPFVAVGDLNGDGKDDMVIGADYSKPTIVALQDQVGDFEISQLPRDSVFEDRALALLDIDNDEDLDIYVVSGGTRWSDGHPNNQNRLYINDGKGTFTISTGMLPEMAASGSTVQVADVDNDGDPDLFVGGYLIPRKYPYAPRSSVLINENGLFIDRTEELAPELQDIGMVTDAKWVDLNKDRQLDLVVVGEWMPVSIFINQGEGQFKDQTEAFGLQDIRGWLKSVNVGDLDGDGYPEIVVGNTGTNTYYKASQGEPIEILAKDFDGTGSIDPIMTHFNQGERYISLFRDQLISQINSAKGRFQRFDDFARSTFDESFSSKEISDAHYEKVTHLESFVLKNNNGQSFSKIDLPIEAQISSVNGIEILDYNNDQIQDILLVGNTNTGDPIRGDLTASYGLLLQGNKDLTFQAITPSNSGFAVDGFCQSVEMIRINNQIHYLVTRNNDHPLIFKFNP